MRTLFARIFTLSFLLAIVLASFSANQALAYGSTNLNCNPYAASTNLPVTTSGNFCSGAAGFSYEPLSQRTDAIAEWEDTDSTYVGTCEIEVWLPYGNFSSDTRTRYDFWYGPRYSPIQGRAHWLGWPGHNINQYSAPAGWYVLAKNLPVNLNSGGYLQLTAHDAGGSGNLAFAAARFTCS